MLVATPSSVCGNADRNVVMRSQCAGAALDPALWIVPNRGVVMNNDGDLTRCFGISESGNGHGKNSQRGLTLSQRRIIMMITSLTVLSPLR